MMKLMTTAAGLLVTVSTVTVLVLGTKSPSSAFGQAIKQLREARSMSYTELLTMKGEQEPIRTKEYIAEDGRRGIERLVTSGPQEVEEIRTVLPRAPLAVDQLIATKDHQRRPVRPARARERGRRRPGPAARPRTGPGRRPRRGGGPRRRR